MAVHKVPQDVEAEDKFLGPLTFKQFLFGGGVVITGYLIFTFVTTGLVVLAIPVLPFFLAFTALAFPWGKDQPTEIWLAGRFRYMFFPRKRIWDQSGVKDLVTVTVPKREVHVYSDGLGQDQVRSRFSALASVVDSRGWVVKNLVNSVEPETDRLTEGGDVEPTKDNSSASNARDVFDRDSSPLPNQLDSLIKQAESNRRQATLHMVDDALHPDHAPSLPNVPADSSSNSSSGSDFWYKNQPEQPVHADLDAIKKPVMNVAKPRKDPSQEEDLNILKAEEKELLRKIHEKEQRKKAKSKPNIQKNTQPPNNQSSVTKDDDEDDNSTSTATVDPGILTLAHNDDLNVETIQRQANKKKDDSQREVVVKLH